MTQAFISGSFTHGGVTFGNLEYGNLKAVAAAITLDPESLSPVVDEDPASGNIREPLLKVIHFMRSLSFDRRPLVKFRHGLFDKMSFKIGQMVFDPPDQFSFFSSDYSPPGVFSENGMVSPESELMSMSSVVGLVCNCYALHCFSLKGTLLNLRLGLILLTRCEKQLTDEWIVQLCEFWPCECRWWFCTFPWQAPPSWGLLYVHGLSYFPIPNKQVRKYV